MNNPDQGSCPVVAISPVGQNTLALAFNDLTLEG